MRGIPNNSPTAAPGSPQRSAIDPSAPGAAAVDHPVASSVQSPTDPADPNPRPEGPATSRRGWLALALAAITTACGGGVRRWRERQYKNQFEANSACPFPLKAVPLDFGPWGGTDIELDPIVAFVAGSRDNIQRYYVNNQTGVALNTLLLFGPGSVVMQHTPENCYGTGSGYNVKSMGNREVVVAAGLPKTQFRVLVCEKRRGTKIERVEVYYSFRIGGIWSPDSRNFKNIERIADVFKLQLERQLLPTEQPDGSDLLLTVENGGAVGRPAEMLIRDILADFEPRLAHAKARATKI